MGERLVEPGPRVGFTDATTSSSPALVEANHAGRLASLRSTAEVATLLS